MKKGVLLFLGILALSGCDNKKSQAVDGGGFRIVETQNFKTLDLCSQNIEDKIKAHTPDMDSKSPPLKIPNAYVIQARMKNGDTAVYFCGLSGKDVIYDYMVRHPKTSK